MSKRELMKKFLNGEITSRVPFSFWHHLVSPPGPRTDLFNALYDQKVYDLAIEGHKKMYQTMAPDFMKLMSDGFFGHPSLRELQVDTAEDLYKVKAVGANHPWIVEQVKFVEKLNKLFHSEVYTFYTIFSPINIIRLHFQSYEGNAEKFPSLFLENPEAVAYAAEEIEKDVTALIERLHANVALDGLYYSVQEVQDVRADCTFHEKYVHPTDLSVIETINKYWENNILHICGYKEYTNDLNLFKDYNLNIINWATYTEKVNLVEGSQLFDGKFVLGGFNNNIGTLLDSGSDQEVVGFINELLDENGVEGIILGSDCTVNPEIGSARYDLIRKTLESYQIKREK